MSAAAPAAAAAVPATPAVALTPAAARAQRHVVGRLVEPKSKKYVGACETRDFRWVPFATVAQNLELDLENGTHVVVMAPGRTTIRTDTKVESCEYESRLIYFLDASKPELQLKVMLNLNSDDFSF